MILFRERNKLAEKYENWLKEYQGIKDCPFNVISFLESEKLLDEEKVKQFLEDKMIHVEYVDNDSDDFEIKDGLRPWDWIPEQQAYLIHSIEGEIVIPAGFVKCLKHIEV